MSEADTEIDPRAAWRADVLKELVEAGMDMVRDMRAVVVEADAPDMSLRFGRVAKAVRMTLALDAKLCDEAAVALEERVAARKAVYEARLSRRKAQVQDGLAHCLERDVIGDDETRKGLHFYDLKDEIEHLELGDEDFLNLPVSQIIAKICEDLGLFVDWNGLRTQDWAMEERKTRPPGSIFANGVPPPMDLDIWDARNDIPPGDIPQLSPDTEPVMA